MHVALKKMLTPPTFANKEQTRLVAWLHNYLLLAILGAVILFPSILESSVRRTTSVTIAGTWLAAHLLTLITLRRGLVRLSKSLIVVSFFIISTATLFLYNGLRSFSIVSFFILLAVVGFLGNVRSLNFFAGLSAIVFIAAYISEQVGLIEAIFIPKVAPITMILLVCALFVHTMILRFTVQSHREQEVRNRRITNELVKHNHALEASQTLLQKAHDELERRVEERTYQLTWTNEQLSQEITDRQQAVNLLLKSEATWRSLVTNAPNTILKIDTGYRILFVNRLTAPLPSRNPVGMSIFEIPIQQNCKSIMQNCFQHVLDSGEMDSFEAVGAGELSGRTFTCRVGPILQNNRIESLILIFTDITKRKKAEEMVLHSAKMESLGVLAGGVAHDFNNLLVAMLGQSSLALLKLDETNNARVHLEKVMKAAERAAHLTKQMLAYSGKSQFLKKMFNLNTLIMENIELFHAAISKNVQLRSYLHEPLPLIEADINQMQQVVMNLILNAAESIEHTLGTVNISTGVDLIQEHDNRFSQWTGIVLAPGKYVRLEIHDNGKGMESETMRKIFDPFFTTKFTGRGLGLAAVLGIVRGHCGGLDVVSSIDEGTIFRLLFPAVPDDVEPHPEENIDDKTAVSPPADTTILVIDDELTILETVSEMLAQAGFHVLTAESGEAGLALYQEKMDQINIILLDLSMPRLSGRDTLIALRTLNPQAGIILSSGYSQQEVQERYFNDDEQLNGTHFLSKPYDPGTLVGTLKQFLVLEIDGRSQ